MEDWIEQFIELAEQYRALGTFLGIFLPFIESFLPFLPLFAFVVANATAYGLWYGFLLSWIGTSFGSYAVFLVIRKFGQAKVFNFLTKRKRVQQLIHWVQQKGFAPLFLFICFPFTPSALVNLVAGLSNMKKKHYLWTLLAGKFVMIFTVSIIGHDIQSMIQNPMKSLMILSVIFVLWLVGKRVERNIDDKVAEDFRDLAREKQEKREQSNDEAS